MQLQAPCIMQLLSLFITCLLCTQAAAATECDEWGSCRSAEGASMLVTKTAVILLDNASLDLPKEFLERRAVFVRWGSRTCPFGSNMLYAGFMATTKYSFQGSGYNYLCMHPSPQHPSGYTSANNDRTYLYGVEYQIPGKSDKDAACAVCQYQNGGATYVEWGHGEPRHNPSTPTQCSQIGHEALYTGLVMGNAHDQQKSEHICVDLERAVHPASNDANDDGGLLYPTEMKAGATAENAYPDNVRVGCTVCGIPALSRASNGTFHLDTEKETNVYTRWGKRSCGHHSRLLYTGFIAGSHYGSSGGGANSVCMTLSGAAAPSGHADSNVNGNRLYGTEYENTGAIDKNQDGDAACAVCEYIQKWSEVYTQWGRQSCSNESSLVYKGLVMANDASQTRSMHLCVDTEREVHDPNLTHNHNGNLLYTTEMQQESIKNVAAYLPYVEVGCAVCSGRPLHSTFTRWGHRGCPDNSKLLYSGFMAASNIHHPGGGSQHLCMHPTGQKPSGWDDHDRRGNSLYGVEYESTGAIDKNHNGDAACAVCELDRWEPVYTQWGRSDTCTNGHQTLYSGYVMSNDYRTNKAEFICVDKERAVHEASSSDNQWNEGQLYTTEMQEGSSDEQQYPNNYEVGCSVCAAISQKDELPFAVQQGTLLHGHWVKLRTIHTGHDVTVSYGYETSSGTSSTAEETKESSYTHLWDVSVCFTATFGTGGFLLPTAEKSIEGCAGYGGEKADSVAKTTAQETSWDASLSESMEDTFYVPDAPPPGTPEAGTIIAHGVHLWQWQYDILEPAGNGRAEKSYRAKANSHYLFSPNSPSDSQPKPPCCYPGQEFGLWYPFNCKSPEGLLKDAEKAQHCSVGPPADTRSHIRSMSSQEIITWLGSLGLSKKYDAKVNSRGLTGPVLAELAGVLDKSSFASGDDNSAQAVELVATTFAVGSKYGDAYIIMAGLLKLLADGS